MIELPSCPYVENVKLALIDFGGVMTPVTGGKSQRINRLGNRFRAEVSMPTTAYSHGGQKLVGRLTRGKTEIVSMRLPEAGFSTGEPGSPVVTSSGQTGTSLNLSGFAPSYTVKEGQFFNVVQGGYHYLYMAAQDAQADSSGNLSMAIYPPLRKATVTGAHCEFQMPVISGFVLGNVMQWRLSQDTYVDVEFTIEEIA